MENIKTFEELPEVTTKVCDFCPIMLLENLPSITIKSSSIINFNEQLLLAIMTYRVFPAPITHQTHSITQQPQCNILKGISIMRFLRNTYYHNQTQSFLSCLLSLLSMCFWKN